MLFVSDRYKHTLSLTALKSGAVEFRLKTPDATIAFVAGEEFTLASFGAGGGCDAHKALSATSHAVILAGTIGKKMPPTTGDEEELVGWALSVLPGYHLQGEE